MMVSTKGRYALIVMIDLARNEGDGYISLSDIAERQNLSMKYLEIVVSMLNKGGLVKSLRGKNGGYHLARKPEEYNIGEILEITEGSLAPVECLKNGHMSCDKAGSCYTLPLWLGLDKVIDDYLGNISLQDLIDGTMNKILPQEIEMANYKETCLHKRKAAGLDNNR